MVHSPQPLKEETSPLKQNRKVCQHSWQKNGRKREKEKIFINQASPLFIADSFFITDTLALLKAYRKTTLLC